jgi:beta-glucanase (GH16 family)
MAPILVTVALPITEQAKTATIIFDPNNPAASGYIKVFEDQFSGYSLDATKWSTGWAWSHGAGTNSTYPNDEALPSNIFLKNGVAHFAVTKGPTPSGLRYGSAVATTYGKFAQAYGYWEAGIQMPTNAHGIWPAFWLVPTDFSWPPEIDIMEWLGKEPTIDYMTLHYRENGIHKQVGANFNDKSVSTGYHKLGMLWTPTSMTWYIDGIQRSTTNIGIPTNKMYIILNNDTGGWDGNIVDSTTVFPSILGVSYVRVFKAPSYNVAN